MNTATRCLPLLLCFLGIAFPSVRSWEKVAPSTGGNFTVDVIADVPYVAAKDDAPDKHRLDLYLPKGHKDYPVLLFVHGGGWTKGDRKSFENLGRLFARNGIGTAVISYRLTPAVQHPAHVQDVACAFAWTHKNIAKYGGRPDRIFVSGHSAGGHLVALLATDEAYLKSHNLSVGNIRGVIPISGVFSLSPGHFTRVFGDNDEARRAASPLTHVRSGLPPMLILVAEKESAAFIKMADDFAEALQKAKCEATCVKIADRNHGTIVSKLVEDEDPTAQQMLAFLAKLSNLKLTPK